MTFENDDLTEKSPLYDDQGLYKLLDDQGLNYVLHEHPAVYTVEAARAHTDHLSGFHIKNLFLRDKKRNFYLVTLEYQRAVDLKLLKQQLDAKGNLSFANEASLYQILGVRPGSVSPFGLVNDQERQVRFFLDEAAPNDHALINPHPLRCDRTLQMAGRDLQKFIASLGYEICRI